MSQPPSKRHRFANIVKHPRAIMTRRVDGCSVCRREVSGRDFVSKHTLKKWAEGAKTCFFCGLVVALLQDAKKKHGVDPSGGGRYEVYFLPHHNAVLGRYYLAGHIVDWVTDKKITARITFYNPMNSKSPWDGIPFDQDISPDSGSKECFALLKHWMTTCQDSHAQCSNKDDGILPTRVLDVTGSAIKLVVSDTLLQGKYVALSHCWGASQPLKTLKENIASHQQGIDPCALPQTFQDAITVTRYLEIQYLWIDSLCIIQDDSLDWEREAAKMVDVYGLAYLVLGASSAAGGSEGFLSRRADHWAGSLKVPCPSSHWMAPIHYRELVEHAMPNSTSRTQGPLETRGWTFQERAMAKRFVSFGTRELFWNCSALWDCECDWTHVRRGKPNDDFYDMQKYGVVLFPRINQLSEEDLYHEWRIAIVYPYSSRDLTFSKDRLFALSAITTTFHERLGDQFLAGLWRKQLHRDLCWYRHARLCDGFETNSYTGPSWSWVSLNPGVTVMWNMPVKGLRLASTCHIIEADCTPASDISPLGPVSAGHITLEGLFLSATATYLPTEDRLLDENNCFYQLKEWSNGAFHADMFLGISEVEWEGSLIETATRQVSMNRDVETETIDFPVWCLVLYTLKSGHTHNTDVLVLGRSVSQPGYFERVGYLGLDLGYTSAEEFFADWSIERVTIV